MNPNPNPLPVIPDPPARNLPSRPTWPGLNQWLCAVHTRTSHRLRTWAQQHPRQQHRGQQHPDAGSPTVETIGWVSFSIAVVLTLGLILRTKLIAFANSLNLGFNW